MGETRGEGQDGGKEREALVGLKKLGSVGIKIGVEQFFGRGDVDFAVFHAEVVTVNCDGRNGKQSQTN